MKQTPENLGMGPHGNDLRSEEGFLQEVRESEMFKDEKELNNFINTNRDADLKTFKKAFYTRWKEFRQQV